MRRLGWLAGVAALGVLAGAAAARAQVTPQNAGKLTLEALTARPPPPPPRRAIPVYHAVAGGWRSARTASRGAGHVVSRAPMRHSVVVQHAQRRERAHRS